MISYPALLAVTSAPGPTPSLPRKLTLVALVAATYAMVSGGPYGLEELIARAGYAGTLAILVITPFLWSLPTALLVGELAAALPEEGGHYRWVTRGLGRFWGFQEGWLSLAASFFDMALYPTLFASYVGQLLPSLREGAMPLAIGAVMIAFCVVWNTRGARAVGAASLGASLLLLAPFAVLVVLSFAGPRGHAPPPPPLSSSIVPGVLVAMWNYMGWDNASTIAGEVERPSRTYPRAMLLAVGCVTLAYLLPVLALAHRGIDASRWKTGDFVSAGAEIGGPWLATAIVLGGALSSFSVFNALVLSYSRLPVALALDGYLPRGFARVSPGQGAPTLSIVVCGVGYAACLGLGFERLVELDVLLYGLSLILEFAALIALRIREPDLPRPFRIRGGVPTLIALAAGPCAFVLLAAASGEGELRLRSLAIAAGLFAAGCVLFHLARRRAALSSSSSDR